MNTTINNSPSFSGALIVRNVKGTHVPNSLKHDIMKNRKLIELSRSIEDDIVVNIDQKQKNCIDHYKLSVTKESQNPVKRFFTRILNKFGYKKATLNEHFEQENSIVENILHNLSYRKLKNRLS